MGLGHTVGTHQDHRALDHQRAVTPYPNSCRHGVIDWGVRNLVGSTSCGRILLGAVIYLLLGFGVLNA